MRSILNIPLSAIGESVNHIEKGRGGMSVQKIFDVCVALNVVFEELCGPEDIFISACGRCIKIQLKATEMHS